MPSFWKYTLRSKFLKNWPSWPCTWYFFWFEITNLKLWKYCLFETWILQATADRNVKFELKVSRSRIKILVPKLLSKNERTDLFFYPDSPEIFETWNQKFKFQVFPDCQDRKINSSVCFWKKLWLNNFVLRSTDL